jgi:GntR family transcriptional regulator
MTILQLRMSWNEPALSAGPVPLWFQIAERLRAAIAAGEFRPGDPLPSEADINGRGSIVLKPRVEQPVNELASFAEDMRRRGLRASYATFSADWAVATAEAAEALQLPAGARAFGISRLLLADDEPMGMSDSWLAPGLLGARAPTPEELDRGSLYEWLARHCGARIAGARQFVEAASADAAMARRLDVAPGAALLVARRLSRAPDGDPIEYVVMHYRADRYRFSIDLTRLQQRE